ncbi:hypothetical protein PIB30_015689 [Stylosanthes scabra]|uniref:Disease resistance protein At4g27190-like leucine-rich repeats domain-containing protein n=1 Tax=Stylosanthes scabra TaxID=79078 RepID=A0ABU6U851_9FABA|nr:hypothetical protein [Stylosanthes scabra]
MPVELFEKTPNLETLVVGFNNNEALKKILPSNEGDANNKEFLGKLKELCLHNLYELKSIGEVEYLPKQLSVLLVSDCPKLETIVLQSSFNLKELRIHSCAALSRLFTSSAAKMLMHLEDLYVVDCESLEEIVVEEQQCVTEDAIEFKHLERITLVSLRSLKCFYSGKATLKLPSLSRLDIANCSKMKVFSHGNVNLSRRIQVSYDFSDDLVFHYDDLNAAAAWKFRIKETLSRDDLAVLQEIWTGKVPISKDCSSCKVKYLTLNGCDILSNAIIPSHLLPLLTNLEELVVENCDYVEAIFDVKDSSTSDTSSPISVPLKKLTLLKLPTLKHVWNHDPNRGGLNFPCLEQVLINECKSIKNLFPASIVVDNLRELDVRNCEEMEEIVANDAANRELIKLYKLTKLCLVDLPKLRCISAMMPTPEGSEISSNALFPSHLLSSVNDLKELMVWNCDSIEAIFDVKDTLTSDSSSAIPLKILGLQKLPTLKHVWNHDPNRGDLNFPCLEQVAIDECKSIKNLFPASIVVDNLRELTVRNCEEMEEIVAKDAANRELIKLHKLTTLLLSHLPKLTCVSAMMPTPEGSEISSNALLPYHLLSSVNDLKELMVWNCDSIEAVFDVKSSSPTQDPNIIDIPLETMVLYLPSLRYVWNEDPKGGFRLPLLKEVIVNGCKCITSLFPASVIFNNKIQKLDVRNCVMLEEIVGEDEAINTGKENNKEHSMMFPCLTTLVLSELPALRCICSGMHTQDCPKLTTLAFAGDSEISLYSNSESPDDKDGFASPPKAVTPHLERLTMDKKSVMMFEKGLLDLDLKNIKYLKLQGFNDIDESDPFRIGFFPNELILSNIEMLVVADSAFKEIFSSKMPEIIHSQLLLKELELRNLNMLESIGLEHTWVASSNLTSIKVEGCTCLKYLFTSSTAKCLDQLQQMHISKCEALESVIVPYQPHDDDDDGGGGGVIPFKGLKKLSLSELPKLESFCKGNSTLIAFYSLEVSISQCKSMKTFSHGDVEAPDLLKVEIDGVPCSKDNLNAAVSQQFES